MYLVRCRARRYIFTSLLCASMRARMTSSSYSSKFMEECMLFFLLFFFFQAEDGIRDVAVTGVQTCALPIFARRAGLRGSARNVAWRRGRADLHLRDPVRAGRPIGRDGEKALRCRRRARRRSEERRVGKECRSRGSAEQ